MFVEDDAFIILACDGVRCLYLCGHDQGACCRAASGSISLGNPIEVWDVKSNEEVCSYITKELNSSKDGEA